MKTITMIGFKVRQELIGSEHRLVHDQKHDLNRARIGIGMNATLTIIVGTRKNCFNEYPQSTYVLWQKNMLIPVHPIHNIKECGVRVSK